MNGQRFVVFLLVCLFAGSNSQPPDPCNPDRPLTNVVVNEGEASSFPNQPDPSGGGVTWTIAPSCDPNSSPYPPYPVAANNIPDYPDVYTVTSTQLSIPVSSTNPRGTDPYSASGLYTVTYSDNCGAMANLIVVSKGPDCGCTMVDADNAQVSCSLEYGVNRILSSHATMTWTTDSGDVGYSETPTPNTAQPNYDVSVSVYAVTSSDAASYTCGITFTPPDAGPFPNMASNAPTYTASCTAANCVKTNATTTIDSTTATTTSSNSQPPDPCNPDRPLTNVVVNEGEASSFLNQPDPSGSGVTWTIAPSYDPSSSPFPPYPVSANNIPDYPDVYTVTSTQLSIPVSSTNPRGTDPYSASGLYTVTYSDNCGAMANLIIVSKGPDCLCNMVDSDNAQVSCSLEYGVNRLLPNHATMTWTTDSGDPVTSYTPQPNRDDPYYDVSTSVYTVTSSDVASYTCGITFTPPDAGPSPNMATNAPTYTASCTVANCVKTTATTTIAPTPTTTAICPKGLINIVAYEGSVAEFENVDDGKPVKWHFSSSSDDEDNLIDITDYDNKVNPMFAEAYSVTTTKLTILSATVAPKGKNPYATAGVYFLTYQSSGCQTAANLIVIQSRPVCDRNENDPNNVILSCNISYAESERQPSYPTMTWTTGSGVIPSDNPTTQKYAYVYESLSEIKVDNTVPSYCQCKVTFNAPASSPIPFLAQNAPSYTESCTVASGTFPPTTEIATTTAVCVDSPNCSSKWRSDPKAFCPYVQEIPEFRDDCPAFCSLC